MFTEYKHDGGVVEVEPTADGGAVIRNPKDHNDTRKISKEDFRDNYVMVDNPVDKDEAEFNARLDAASKDEPKPLNRSFMDPAPKPNIATPDEGFPKKNPDRVMKDK